MFKEIKKYLTKPIPKGELILIILFFSYGMYLLINNGFFYKNKPINILRPSINIKDNETYNVIKLANPKRASLVNIYSYLPNSNQLVDNIPSCMVSQKKEVLDYIKSYDLIFKSIANNKTYKDLSAQEVGVITKAVLDYDYNFYNYKYFRDFLKIKTADGKSDVKNFLDMGASNTYKTREPLSKILDSLFTEDEQISLANTIADIYKQARKNCVQAGYGKDFYSVFWSGMPEQYGYDNSSYTMQAMLMYVLNSMKFKNALESLSNKNYSNIFEGLKFSKGLISNQKKIEFIIAKQLYDLEYIGGKLRLNMNMAQAFEVFSDDTVNLDFILDKQQQNPFYMISKINKKGALQLKAKGKLDDDFLDCEKLSINSNFNEKIEKLYKLKNIIYSDYLVTANFCDFIKIDILNSRYEKLKKLYSS